MRQSIRLVLCLLIVPLLTGGCTILKEKDETANWTAEQADAPYKALGGAADQVRKTVTDAAVDLSRQAEKAVPGLKVTFPQLTPKGA